MANTEGSRLLTEVGPSIVMGAANPTGKLNLMS